MKIKYNNSDNILVINSLSIESVIIYLKGRDFLILEMRDLKDNLIYRNDDECFLNDEDTFWVREDHGIEINSIIELIFSNEGLGMLSIRLTENDFILFKDKCLTVKIHDKFDLRRITINLLKNKGLFVSNLIWDISEITKLSLCVSTLLGYDYHEIEDKLDYIYMKSLENNK